MKSLFVATIAIGLLCTVPAHAGKSPDAYQLCLSYVGRADPDAFIAACTKVIASGGIDLERYGVALANRALMYARIKRYDLAVQDCERALKVNFSQTHFALQACGLAHAGKGEYGEAVGYYDRAVHFGVRKWIDPLLGRASAHLQQREYEAAIADCDAAIGMKRDSADAFLLRGQIYLAQKLYAKAILDFDATLKLDPSMERAALDRQDAMTAQDAARPPQQQPAASLPVAEGLLQSCTSKPGPGGTNQARIEACTKIIENTTTPVQTRVTALKARGYLNGVEGRMALLSADYQEATFGNPENPMHYYTIAEKQVDNGHPELAIANYSEALRLEPKFIQAYQMRCRVRAELGESPELVLADCDKAIELAPNDLLMLRTRARVLVQLGFYERAIGELDTLLMRYPDNHDLTLNRCEARAFGGMETDLAFVDCNKLAAFNAQAMIARAVIFYRQGDFAAARLEATRALSVNPKLGEALYLRGMAKRKLNAPDGDSDIDAATALNPRIAQLYVRRGVAQ